VSTVRPGRRVARCTTSLCHLSAAARMAADVGVRVGRRLHLDSLRLLRETAVGRRPPETPIVCAHQAMARPRLITATKGRVPQRGPAGERAHEYLAGQLVGDRRSAATTHVPPDMVIVTVKQHREPARIVDRVRKSPLYCCRQRSLVHQPASTP
jgi:hypothetical protein